MPARLDPEERERRRKARSRASFSDAAYKHYDPTIEGFGSASEWRQTVHERMGTEPVVAIDADLQLLGLAKLTTLAALRLGYRRSSRTAHPDGGGSEAAFNALTAAFDRLKARLGG